MDFDSDEDVRHDELLRDIESLDKPNPSPEKDCGRMKKTADVERVEIFDLLRSVKSTR